MVDGTVVKLKASNPSHLLWLLDIPWEEAEEGIPGSYVITINGEDRNLNIHIADAVLWHAFQSTDMALVEKALDWVDAKRASLDPEAAAALRDVAESLEDEGLRKRAEDLLAIWRVAWKTIPKMTDEDLKKFVLDYLAGGIFTSLHVRNPETDLPMVFMVIALGGLSVPDAMLPGVPHLPKKPREPVKDALPREPEKLEKPAEPEYEEPDLKHIEDLEFKVRWNHLPTGAVDSYLQEVKDRNAKAKAEWEAEVAGLSGEHKKTRAKWRRQCKNLKDKHQKALQEYAAEVEAWETENAEIIAAHKARKAVEEEVFKERAENIGIVWEYMKQANPMGINGMPTFFSMRIMHREDWDRCRKAINRQLEAQRDLEV